MAAVYKSVSKKQAKQLARQQEQDDSDAEMADMADLLADADDTSDSEDDEEINAESAKKQLAAGFMPKTRVLMLTSRGVTHRHRHLLADLAGLLPHTHKESKLDTKKKTAGYNLLLNSLADLHSCNVIFFLEARKHGQDLYLWLARPPNGPTLKFHVNNLHTMSELNAGFSGNCLKGGRGIVVFDRSFDEQGPVMSQPGNEYRGLVREMLRGVFSVPKRGIKGMKPFIDRIIGVFGVDGKIWIRVYEMRESEAGGKKKSEDGEETVKPKDKDGLPDVSLVEIGPRFVLTPIVILEGSFGGPVIYENKEYVSPNQVRHDIRISKAGRHAKRRDMETDRFAKRTNLGLGEGEHTPATMPFGLLATELLLHVFRSCETISDVLNLTSTCRRLRVVFNGSNKLQIITEIAEREFGPLDEIIQLVTQNASQPAHLIRTAPMTDSLLKQIIHVGRVAQKWEAIYPVKKWKEDYENRRSLTDDERSRLRRAIYRLWLYHRAFHTRTHERFSRKLRHIVMERAQLLHNWSTQELADIEDVRLIICDIIQNHICPSNGTIQRKFRKRYPENHHQLAFNIHLNYPAANPLGSSGPFDKGPNRIDQYYYTAYPGNMTESPAKYKSRFRNDFFHDPGAEGWGDEIPHYYVVQDMMKLDPGQVLWLREHAPLKEQVEGFVLSLGDWFRDNGETFGDTLEWVMNERGDDMEEFRTAISDREIGIVWD
ncbi:Brix-domain-containing protein [Aspergillus coremiiformis]|uniref:Brix-domain-containing protein n=1 Tax=Aspergillus coremiiformis TaxID=138285 RepID=A0A5N6ZGM4_9EURO|nr:Brix-domain-containing protein [Aspergillus coremiiformis]